jgi:hypothetical protein
VIPLQVGQLARPKEAVDRPGDERDEEMSEKMDMSLPFEAPWIEKYRPELLADIVGNTEAISRLSAIAQVATCTAQRRHQ